MSSFISSLRYATCSLAILGMFLFNTEVMDAMKNGQEPLRLRGANHGAWLPAGSRVRETSWRPFERIFCNGERQTRYICEIVFGWRGSARFYLITIDPRTLPKDGTWYIMTNLEGKIQLTVGNTYGLRTWIEYGFKQTKNELGWADYRVTDYASIERWWELVFCAYTSSVSNAQSCRRTSRNPSRWKPTHPPWWIVSPSIPGGTPARAGKIP